MWTKIREYVLLALIGIGAGIISVGLLFGLPLQKILGDPYQDWALPVVPQIEKFVSDLRVASLVKPQPPHDKIVVATITEDTLQLFPYRSPINRQFLAGLVLNLQEKGAAAIALDIIFDTPTEAEADQLLQQVLRESKIPVFTSYGDAEQLPQKNLEFQNKYLEGIGFGFANVVKDEQDGVVRDIFPGRVPYCGHNEKGDLQRCTGDLSGFAPSLPAVIASVMGVKPPTAVTPLVYRGFPADKTGEDKIYHSFRRFPSHTIPLLPAAWFKDKIVFIGAELTDIDLDMKLTPYRSLYGNKRGQVPGVLVHAHALAQILDGTHFPKLPVGGEIALIVGIALLGALLAKIDLPTWARLSIALGIVGLLWAAGFFVYDEGGPLIPLVTPSVAFLTAAWIGDIYAGSQDREQRKFITNAFKSYLPPVMVDQLAANPGMLMLGGERREMTMLFTDVAGFTTISESLSAATLVHVLNEYMDGMTRIVSKHGGMVDKFIGDAVFAIFGAPLKQEDHAQRAVGCALEMGQFADQFVLDCKDETGGTLKDKNGNEVKFGITRIGVHTGEATIGNFGSTQKMDYTALGDSVNAAARLEGLNKQFGTRVAISIESVKRSHGFHFRPIASVIVKGKTEPIDIFTPVTADDAKTPLVTRYNEAYAYMAAGDSRCREMFLKLAEDFPEDSLVRYHVKRLAVPDKKVSALVKLDEK
ncbi:MAG: adenylate/guanylate cyclase domain-containing protein [Alphaproteobacteria bacterium]|nr:adenylate/guanylate cyclase domain-containing protein [Alphaproteobacteria bacterium]